MVVGMGFVGGDGTVLGRGEVLRRPRCCSVSKAVERGNGNGNGKRAPLDLTELTKRLGDLLGVESKGNFADAFVPVKEEVGGVAATTQVAVVFGKALVRDQLTVEYAKRILALVKQITAGEKRISVVCFAGGRRHGGLMSEAAAGYSFFRSICDRCHIDISDLRMIVLEMDYDTSDAMLEISRRVKEQILGGGGETQCHFTLISSDYDLFRVQEIQRLSASRSFLRPLVVARSTWDFVYAFYPYCVSHDGITAFLGRVTVLTADLSIVLTNLEAVISESSFFAKENWDRLNSTIAKFRHYCEMLHHPRAEFREDMRIQTEVLEKCLFDLRETQRLLTPLMDSDRYASHTSLEEARVLLTTSICTIKKEIDPDRPMTFPDMECIAQELDEHMLSFEAAEERLTAKKAVETIGMEKKALQKKKASSPKKTSRSSTKKEGENVE